MVAATIIAPFRALFQSLKRPAGGQIRPLWCMFFHWGWESGNCSGSGELLFDLNSAEQYGAYLPGPSRQVTLTLAYTKPSVYGKFWFLLRRLPRQIINQHHHSFKASNPRLIPSSYRVWAAILISSNASMDSFYASLRSKCVLWQTYLPPSLSL